MVSGRSRLLLAPALGVVAALAVAPSASAAVSCTFDDTFDIVDVQISGTPASPERKVELLVESGSNIVVERNDVAVNCTGAGGPPSTTNTDTVTVTDTSDDPSTPAPADFDARLLVLNPASFAPGDAPEVAPETPEIEFSVDMGNGTDDRVHLVDDGTADNDVWQFGDAGINWNGAGSDSDLEVNPTGADDLIFDSGGASDFISGQGGDGTGGPFSAATLVFLSGGDFSDQLNGGDGNDRINGADGNDAVRGFGGADDLLGRSGLNTIDGGQGTDTALFGGDSATVDLAMTGPQDTGEAVNTLSGVENVFATPGDDTLIGDEGANVLIGDVGADTLVGRGGSDKLFGGAENDQFTADGGDLLDGGAGDDLLDGNPGVDTATFAGSSAGVTANLNLGVASGAGADTLAGVENLTGSPFADSLTGDDFANAITGLGGSDAISADAGPDAVDVRDGEADVASCGSEIDTAIADRASLDSVDADCETIDFLAEIQPPGGDPIGDTELSFDLSGKAKQRVLKQKGVVVRALCPLEDCTATASGKVKLVKPRRETRAKLNLKPVTEAVAAGVAEKIKLPLKRKQLRAIAAALRSGTTPKVTVRANVSDAVGNVATDTLTVKTRR